MLSSMNGTSSLISAGVTSDTGSTAHDFAEAMRRRNSSMRSSVRATSSPPLSTKTPSSFGTSSTTNLNLTGNDFSNRIYGNAGVNALKGFGGNDLLSGGAAHD